MTELLKNKISRFLLNKNISHKIKDDCFIVVRDDVVNAMNKHYEYDAYSALISDLNNHFNCRFVFTCKNDDWLMLECLKSLLDKSLSVC